MIILVAFVLCWVPFLVQFVLVLSHGFDMDDRMQLYFVTFANMFYFLGCGINPLVYISRCARFRDESLRLLCLLGKTLVCCEGELREKLAVRGKVLELPADRASYVKKGLGLTVDDASFNGLEMNFPYEEGIVAGKYRTEKS